MAEDDKIRPDHYRGFSNGAAVIDIVERLNFNRGNAIKYIARAGRKPGESTLDDLQKARNYLDREIERIINDGKETAPVLSGLVGSIVQNPRTPEEIAAALKRGGQITTGTAR